MAGGRSRIKANPQRAEVTKAGLVVSLGGQKLPLTLTGSLASYARFEVLIC